MLNAILSLFRMILLILGGYEQVALENIALREQLAIFQRSVRRPKIRPTDRLFWVCLRKVWKEWKSALVIVRPFAKIHASFRYMYHGSIPVAFHCSQTSQADDLRFDCTRQCDQEVIATTMSSFLNSVGVRLSFTQRVAGNDDAGHRLVLRLLVRGVM